ncbi:hypothetical protein ACWGJ9_08710 [Curtobacterium citreum]
MSKLSGGNYRSAPRRVSGMICVDCVLDLLPYAVRWPNGYSGAGRWSTPSLLFNASDLYVPTTEAEARRSGAHASWDARA